MGYIPRLVKDGFRGQILASSATVDIARIVLPDSGHLQEEDAAFANKKGFSKHAPALPLYTYEEAVQSLEYIHTVDAYKPVEISPHFTITYGLRWDLNPPMKGKNRANDPFTLVHLDNPAAIALAPRGTPLYQTTYGNVAPRFGLAWQLRPAPA